MIVMANFGVKRGCTRFARSYGVRAFNKHVWGIHLGLGFGDIHNVYISLSLHTLPDPSTHKYFQYQYMIMIRYDQILYDQMISI
jgi:hypothetical protein